MLVVLLHQHVKKRFLAGIITIQRPGRNAGGFDDRAERGGLKASFQEFRLSGLQDPFLRVWLVTLHSSSHNSVILHAYTLLVL